MKPRLISLSLVLCALAWSSCRKGSADEKSITGLPQAGAIYSLNDGEGGYRLGKVLVVEEEVIFTKLFADRWTRRPSVAQARKAATPIPVAYKPQSFADMRPVHLENGTVTAEESQAYESWKTGAQEIF